MYALQIKKLVKRFGNVQVLFDIDLDIKAGEVHALIGENGAGKSTLVNLIAGIHRRDSGEMLLEGRAVDFENPLDAMKAGISVVHQELSLAPNASVAENIYLRRELKGRLGFNDWRAMEAKAAELFQRIGLEIDPSEMVGRLSVGMQQMVEIAKAIALNARVIIMDEPSSSLSEHEVAELFSVVRSLKAQGIAIVFISHKLSELFELSDRITVLRDGRLVGTVETQKTDSAEIIRMMVGRHLGDLYPPRGTSGGKLIFSCRNLSRYGYVRDVNFDVREGEIVGLTGLVGAGRTEAMRAIVNADRRQSGEFVLNGKKVSLSTPRDAVEAGVYYVSEDRKGSGLFLQSNVGLNIVSSNMSAFSSVLGRLNRRKIYEHAEKYISEMDIRPPRSTSIVFNLSGGNQQKVMLSKAMTANPRVLIVDEPTRGVDVGAKALIHAKLRQLANQGIAVIVISSDLPEVLGLSDRLLIFRNGTISRELDNHESEATQESVMSYATES